MPNFPIHEVVLLCIPIDKVWESAYLPQSHQMGVLQFERRGEVRKKQVKIITSVQFCSPFPFYRLFHWSTLCCGGRGKVQGRERILSRFHPQCGAQHRAWSYDPEIMSQATIKSWMLNQLKHPGDPHWSTILFFPAIFIAGFYLLLFFSLKVNPWVIGYIFHHF